MRRGKPRRCRPALEILERRDLLSFDPVAGPFVFSDPLFGFDQAAIRIAAAPDAAEETIVTVFQTAELDGDGLGVFAQIQSAAGVATIQVNTSTAGDQSHPDVAVFSDQSFVVTWQGPSTDGSGNGIDIYARSFDKNGQELTPETRVNTTVAGDQTWPVVAGDNLSSNHEFVVGWQGPGDDGEDVFAQFYGEAGAVGNELRVNTTVAGDQIHPDVAMQAGFGHESIFVWEGPDADGSGIYAQRFDQQTPTGNEIVVNPFAVLGNQRDPKVAVGAATVVSFIGPMDSITGLEAVYGATIGDGTGVEVSNDFLVSQGGLNPIGGHDVATVDRQQHLQIVFGWANGNQITLAQYEGLAFGDTVPVVPTFVTLPLGPDAMDAVPELSQCQLTSADVALVSTRDSSGNLFKDGLVLATNPVCSAEANDPARQEVLLDLDVEPADLVSSIDAGFPARVLVFDDLNGDGIQDAGEEPLEGVTFFVDSNGNGRQDPLLPLEDFTVQTDFFGEALIYNADGLIPMSVLIDDSQVMTTETTGALVINHHASFASSAGLGPAYKPGSSDNDDPKLGIVLRRELYFDSDSGAVLGPYSLVDSAGQVVDPSQLEFVGRSDDIFRFYRRQSDESLLFSQPTTHEDSSALKLNSDFLGLSRSGRFPGILGFRFKRTLRFDSSPSGQKTLLVGNFKYKDAPVVAPDERLLDFGALNLNGDEDDDVLVVVQLADGTIEMRAYLFVDGMRFEYVSTTQLQPEDNLISVRLQTAQLAGSEAASHLPDVTLQLAEKRPDGFIENSYFTIINFGNGLLSVPEFAAAVIPGHEYLDSAFPDVTLDGIADLVREVPGECRIRLEDGFPVGDPDNPATIFGGSVLKTYDICDGGEVKGITATDDRIHVFTTFDVLNLRLTHVPVVTLGLTTPLGLFDRSLRPGPREFQLGARITFSPKGADGVIVQARDDDGNTIAETVTSSVDLNGNGRIELLETGVFTMAVPDSLSQVTLTFDLTGGFGFPSSLPNLDVRTPESRELVVDLTNCPCTVPEISIGEAHEDFGDAPASYGTLLADDGPRHTIVAELALGSNVDGEFDGIPSEGALGDDRLLLTDEDGVSFLSDFIPGQSADIGVYATAAGKLDAFVDFDGDGKFSDPFERLFGGSLALDAGFNQLSVSVPGNAIQGPTYARFRISLAGGLGPSGAAPDGEVEDYGLLIQSADSFDFGDAPRMDESVGRLASYPTFLADDGARHVVLPEGPFLGLTADEESDGQPTAAADGDDTADTDDEDGVTVISSFVSTGGSATTASVAVLVTGAGQLDGWLDFNGDGDWLDPGEQIFHSQAVVEGLNLLSLEVPAGSVAGNTAARFRLSSAGGLAPTGLADDGEVEDYLVTLLDGEAAGGASAAIDLPISATVHVTVDGEDVLVQSGQIDLFRAPGSSVNQLQISGTPGDDTILLDDVSTVFTGPLTGDTGAGTDTLRLMGSGQTLDLTSDNGTDLQGLEAIDITGNGDNSLTLNFAKVLDLSPTTDTLRVQHDKGDHVDYGLGWQVELPQIVDDQFVHVVTQEDAVVQVANTLAYQNPLIALDVNHDGNIVPIDVLIIINRLNDTGSETLETPSSLDGLTVYYYYDTNGDGVSAPIDALVVINRLNNAEGEGLIDWSPLMAGVWTDPGRSTLGTNLLLGGARGKKPIWQQSVEMPVVSPSHAMLSRQKRAGNLIARGDADNDQLFRAVDAIFGELCSPDQNGSTTVAENLSSIS